MFLLHVQMVFSLNINGVYSGIQWRKVYRLYMVNRVFGALLSLLLVPLAAKAQPSRNPMALEEKAGCVVGLESKDFPTPTNTGIPGRTADFPDYNIPSLVMADGTSGIRLSRSGKDRSTAFPSSIADSTSEVLPVSESIIDEYDADKRDLMYSHSL